MTNPSTEHYPSAVLFRLTPARSRLFQSSGREHCSSPDTEKTNELLCILPNTTTALYRRPRWYHLGAKSEHPEFCARHRRDAFRRSACHRAYCVLFYVRHKGKTHRVSQMKWMVTTTRITTRRLVDIVESMPCHGNKKRTKNEN